VRDEGMHRGMKKREGAGPRNRACFLSLVAIAGALRLRILQFDDYAASNGALGNAAIVR
jgi:hypothetical protein